MGELNLQPLYRIGRESLALKEEKVSVTSGKKKASVRKETVAVSDTMPKIVRKNQNTHSEPAISRGRNVSRKRSIRGTSHHGSILRQPCRYYLKGTCTRTSCEYWHPPECQFYKKWKVVRLETSVCFRIARLMNNQIKSRRRAAFMNSCYFCHRWIVYSWRRSTVTDGCCKGNTSNDPFSRCATSYNYGYSLNWRWRDKVGLQPRRKLGLRTRGETERQDAQHQWRRDNQDHHSAHETQHLTSECARSLLVSSCCRHLHLIAHHIAWLKLCACLTSPMHVVSVTLRLWALHSIQLPLLLILLQSPAVPAALLPLPWGQQ